MLKNDDLVGGLAVAVVVCLAYFMALMERSLAYDLPIIIVIVLATKEAIKRLVKAALADERLSKGNASGVALKPDLEI